MINFKELRSFVKENPDVPTNEVAEKFGCTKQNVWTARHAVGVSKKIVPYKKKRLKVVRKSTLDFKDKEIKRLTEELDVANQINKDLHKNGKPSTGKDWEAEYNLAVLRNKHLEKVIDEHKVVIGYLEHVIFVRGEKNGNAV